jgi:hypothetical protein
MGYVRPEDIPALPTSISLDADKVSEVVDSMRDILTEMGRKAPTVETATTLPEEDSTDDRVKSKLNAADALLRKLNRGETGE